MKLAECFEKGLLKRISPDVDIADRSLRLSLENIDDVQEILAYIVTGLWRC